MNMFPAAQCVRDGTIGLFSCNNTSHSTHTFAGLSADCAQTRSASKTEVSSTKAAMNAAENVKLSLEQLEIVLIGSLLDFMCLCNALKQNETTNFAFSFSRFHFALYACCITSPRHILFPITQTILLNAQIVLLTLILSFFFNNLSQLNIFSISRGTMFRIFEFTFSAIGGSFYGSLLSYHPNHFSHSRFRAFAFSGACASLVITQMVSSSLSNSWRAFNCGFYFGLSLWSVIFVQSLRKNLKSAIAPYNTLQNTLSEAVIDGQLLVTSPASGIFFGVLLMSTNLARQVVSFAFRTVRSLHN